MRTNKISGAFRINCGYRSRTYLISTDIYFGVQLVNHIRNFEKTQNLFLKCKLIDSNLSQIYHTLMHNFKILHVNRNYYNNNSSIFENISS